MGIHRVYMVKMGNLSSMLCIILCINLCLNTLAANWAQTTGKVSQNVVIPQQPKPAHPHWEKRYGMAVVVVDDPDDPDDEPRIFLMGGDTYDGDFTGNEKNTREGKWSNGYKNDVWRSTGTEWEVLPDVRLKQSFHRNSQKIPRIKSQMEWIHVTSGELPPPSVSYDYWLRCTDPFKPRLVDPAQCNLPVNKYKVQWSPRRHHAALYFKGYIWVLGGRARELSDIPEENSVGGILTPRIQDIYRQQFGENHDQYFTHQREVSTLKSDVWRSSDGESWQLMTPGCKSQQINLVASGNKAENRFGTLGHACEGPSSPCYSPAESCTDIEGHYTCVCDMWSPREQHQAATYGEYMYVVGGYASRLFSEKSNCGAFACGDTNAGSYRFYMQDVWRSFDGVVWEEVTLGGANSFPGRGGHQMIVLPGDDMTKLMIFGGATGNPNTNEVTYLNDVWWADIDNPAVWHELTDVHVPWSPRTAHTVTLEPQSALKQNTRIVYLVGGVTAEGISDEVWAWWPDVEGEIWRQDYSAEAKFRSALGRNGLYEENSPATYYVTPDSNLTYLRKFWVPTASSDGVRDHGSRPEIRKYLEEDKLELLHRVGIYTIRQLAEADKYTILKLRGFDYPGTKEEDLMDFYEVCDIRELAIAVVKKCSINYDVEYYDGENKMPWNLINEFGGGYPVQLPAEWHNKNFLDMHFPTDPIEMIEQWDGCSPLDLQTRPNVNGIGKVSQVGSIRDPHPELQELQCRFNPGPRAYHAALYVEERLYIFGGRKTNNEFYADSWYRDDRMPSVNIKKKPKNDSPNSIFRFAVDEPGCYFEFRVWASLKFKEIKKWTPVVSQTNLEWLDWRKGGPGNGRYVLYVRAVDPAGNRDELYERGRNVYAWNYVSPMPWDIIFGCVAGFIFLAFLAYLEYRRRVKRAAMERYAMKRMRRKFKAMQRDLDGRAVDWRTLYQEHKDAKESEDKDGKKKQKEMKKKREKAKESREKEKQKLAKEKEKIRKKLKDKEKKSLAGGSAAGSTPLAIENTQKSETKYLGDAKKEKLIKGSETETTIEKKHTKRFKDYEIEDVEGGGAAAGGGELKKSNTKRLKDYEADAAKNKKDN